MKARYVGNSPVLLVSGKILEPGEIIDIAEHERERPDFEPVVEKEEQEVVADAGSTEAGLYRPGKTGRKGNSGSAE